MSILNKKTLSAQYMNRHKEIFQCPICTAKMKIIESKSLVCGNLHAFDLAKQGYVNLLTKSLATKYDKALFESRKLVADSGFFTPLSNALAEIILAETTSTETTTMKILDTGCGEGSHLKRITDTIQAHFTGTAVGVGVDLSKEGIMVAAKNYADLIWCVADLAKSPFANETFTVILNILSPSNYKEFSRILTCDGIVIKVVPRNEYLKEIRAVFYEQSDKQSYSNQNIVERFSENFISTETRPLAYKVKLTPALLPHLIQMTPLSWGVTEAKINTLLETGLSEITVDFDILIGRKK